MPDSYTEVKREGEERMKGEGVEGEKNGREGRERKGREITTWVSGMLIFNM